MMFLAISLLPWTAFLYYLSLGGASFRWALSLFKTFPGKAYLVLLSFCLVYHFLNGLRHIAWDFGALLDLHVAKKTGWIIFILSFLSSLCVAWRAFV
jgi:succinate dehydrogenase cytochrome b556 subunit